MTLSEICIKRPVLAIVISLIMIVSGLVGYSYLNTRFFPKFQQNLLMISTYYPGASAKLVESSITSPIEEAISGVEGIKDVYSTSGQGESSINVDLMPSVDPDVIANKMRNKISLNSYKLPTSVKPPVVQVGWGNMDLLDIGITSTSQNLLSLRDYVERYLINQIEELPNVADVEVDGANKYAMRIALNPEKLHAYGLSVDDIKTVITNSNLQLPAGDIKANTLNYPITANTELHNAQQFSDLILKNTDHHVVRLKDVATVTLGHDSASRTIVRINGQRGINITVFNTTDGNPITASDSVLKLLKQIKNQLPAGMKLTVTFNQAHFMKTSIHEVYVSISIAVLCVIAIIFIFLGRLRSILIPLATIPVCIISTFALIYAFGYTLNIITLLAIVLSIGLIVDDAIVMLENIYRHIELGKTRLQAAYEGSREITFTVIAMTITLAAVYAPIGLIKGKASHIFGSFAYTLAGAVIISGIVALTLSPMMCARVLPTKITYTGYSKFLYHFFNRLKRGYQRVLRAVLQVRLGVIATTLSIAVGGYFLVTAIPKGFMPAEDMGFMMVNVKTPSGSNMAYNSAQEQKVYQLLKQFPAIEDVSEFATQSLTQVDNVFVTLKPISERTQSVTQLVNAVNKRIQHMPALDATAFAPSFGGSMQHPLQFYVLSSGSYYDLYQTTQKMMQALRHYPGIKSIDTPLKFDNPQYALTVNRALASQLDVSTEHIDNTLATLLGGSTISTFDMGGHAYDVDMQAQEQDLHSLNTLNKFYVKSSDGQLIPMSNLIHITPTSKQLVLSHYDRLRAALSYANLSPGYKISDVVMYLQQHLSSILPSHTTYAFTGMAKQISDTSSNMGLMFILGIVFIYLVLAAQFESFLDPLIILLAVPLSIVSALAALKLAGDSLDIYTAIGLMTLIGLIAKHGILITQFANTLQQQGKDATTALIEAAGIRLRPILMTTAAMVFGALPLLLSHGANANSRHEIGMVIIVGLLCGTFFSLLVVPVMYSLVAQLKNKFHRKRHHGGRCG
ncbi:MAG: multidrug transporter AcrB [Coxiella sp. (in: Bacteria)]|nr:MAG: multidrug transporter AcrB [Coxiella sp. (in: g-proteobacteria)]